MKDKAEVIKHIAAVHAENKIDRLQRRSWNVMLANAYEDLPSKEEYTVSEKELMGVLEYDSHNTRYLRDRLKGLMTYTIEWNVLGEDEEEEWGATTLLASIKFKNGTYTYSFSPELRRRLYNPAIYARISLSLQNKFDGGHAQALWELCVSIIGTWDYGESHWIPIVQFRKLMAIPDDKYTEFKLLNYWVIKKPLEEINARTDYTVVPEYKRERRKVTAVKFRVKKVVKIPQPDPQQARLPFPADDMPDMVKALVEAGLAEDDALEIWQRQWEYVNPKKRPNNGASDLEVVFSYYVREKIDLLQRREKQGKKIDSRTGFLISAIKEDYTNAEFARAQRQKRQSEHVQKQERAAQQDEEWQRQFDVYREEQFWERFHAKPLSWQEKQKQAFVEKIKGEKQYRVVWDSYQRHQRLDLPIVFSMFMQDLEAELLTEQEETSLEEFKARNDNRALNRAAALDNIGRTGGKLRQDVT